MKNMIIGIIATIGVLLGSCDSSGTRSRNVPNTPTDADVERIKKSIADQLNRMQATTMLLNVEILEYLLRDDIEAAKEHLRKNIAYQYREEIEKGRPIDDSIMKRVEKMSQIDADLRHLLELKHNGEQDADGRSDTAVDSKDQ